MDGSRGGAAGRRGRRTVARRTWRRRPLSGEDTPKGELTKFNAVALVHPVEFHGGEFPFVGFWVFYERCLERTLFRH